MILPVKWRALLAVVKKVKQRGATMVLFHEIILLTFLFGATFIFVLPSVCQNLGFSMYYNPSKTDKTTIDRENDLRVLEAKQTIKNLESSLLNNNFAKQRPAREKNTLDFAIVLISVHRRANPHYLLQTAVRLMLDVEKDQGNSEILIFNADKKPELNGDVQLLSRFVKIVNRSAVDPVGEDIFEKEQRDYMYALNLGLQLGSRYIVVVEDDALATVGILGKLRYLLKWKTPRKWLRSNSRTWAYLKLYYPEKWQGFGNTEIHELLIIGVLGALCFTIFRRKVFKTPRKSSADKKILYTWCLCGFLYFILVAYSFGRAHWIEMRKILPLLYGVSTAPRCCTPALLFPADQARNLVEFLSRTKFPNGYPIDFALDDFARQSGIQGLLVSPNLFTHIGFHSSLHSYDKNTNEFKLLFRP